MTYRKSVLLPVSPDEAFALVTQPERMRRWQTVTATVDLRAGGAYRWTIVPGHVAVGTYREIEPGKRVVFGWGWDGSDDLQPDSSTVTVTVEPADGGSRVTLVHEGLTEEQTKSHAEGWDHFLERLERLATTGDAGPDEWAFAPENLTPIVAAEAALAALQPVLRNLKPADADRPTPCADFDCADLVEHLIGALVQVGGMTSAALSAPTEGSAEDRVSTAAADAIAAWRQVDLDGMLPGPNGPMPAAFLASILPLELVLHGWDIAQASGQHQHISDALVDYVREITAPVIGGGRGSSFAPETTPSDDASAVDRFAAFAGRTPVAA